MPDHNSSVNFALRKTIQSDSTVKKVFDWTLKSGIKIIIITEAIVLLTFILKIGSDREIHALSEKVEEQQKVIEQQRGFEQLFNKRQAKLMQLENILKTKTDWVETAQNFNRSIPQGVVLTRISYLQDDIEFDAKVNSPDAFGILISRLKSNSSVKSLTLLSSKYNTEDKLYELSLNLKY